MNSFYGKMEVDFMAQWQPSTFTPDKTADTAAYAASLSASATSQSLNRTFLSSLFEQIFNSPSEALSLYNAINGTNYSDPGLLTITTLSGALFLGYRNDFSFLIGTTLNLYEHQSMSIRVPSTRICRYAVSPIWPDYMKAIFWRPD